MDIDIDFKTDFDPLEFFTAAVRASMVEKGELKKHPAGAYLQNIPKDKITGLSAIPYKQAEELGYFKVDFLHLSLLDIFDNKEEIRALLKKEPDWSLLEDQETVEKLFQISRHYDIVVKVKPKSIEEISDVMALIRPGKRFLLDAYVKDRKTIRKELYKRPEDPKKYYFKRSHSLAYALNVVLQLHLIKAKIL
jgi:DNA polymerase III alpha subunit